MQAVHTSDHTSALLQGWIKTALLIGLGLYFVYNIVSGNLTNYINVRFAWLSYVAAALFLLIGGHSAWQMLREQRAHQHGHEHTHAHGMSWGALGVIAVPLLLGTLIPSRPLGAEAVGSVSVSGGVGVNATVSAFSISPQDRNVLDWLRAFNNAADYTEISGQPADITGFVYVEPTFPEGVFMVARFTISCCVADASAIGLPVAWAEAANLQQGDWVRVQGTMQVGEFRGDSAPILQAASVERIEQPAHPYLYP